MTTANRRTRGDTGSERAGTITVVLGALALAATVFTYMLSLSENFNPLGWVRAVGLVWLPSGSSVRRSLTWLPAKGPGGAAA